MKDGIHPKIYEKAKTTCTACGTVFTIPNTAEAQQIEICSHCHPVYTGKYRGVTGGGRVERFRKKVEEAKAKGTKKTVKRELTAEEKLVRRVKAKSSPRSKPKP